MAGLRSLSHSARSIRLQASETRVSRFVVAALLGVVAFAASGCAGIMMPLSAWMSGGDKPAAAETTGSIGLPDPRPEPVDTDAETVRRTLEVANARKATTPLAWKNETTGHSGTLTKVAEARAANGAPCRDFETTLVTVEGVDLHTGRMCQGYSGLWEMLRFDRAGG